MPLVIILGAVEPIAAYMLFRYGAVNHGVPAHGLASVYLVEKAPKIRSSIRSPAWSHAALPARCDPGLHLSPGRHRVSIALGRKTMSLS